MTRQQALELLQQNIRTPNLMKHLLATEVLMKGLAERLGEDRQQWALAGLLHDLDWDLTKSTPNKHSLVAYEMLKGTDLDPAIAEAIKIHNPIHGLILQTKLDKALYSGEAMTGFIAACALVQPDKKLTSLNRESILKKFRSKSFAAGADREIMAAIEPMLGISLEELIDICLREMQGIAGDLGL